MRASRRWSILKAIPRNRSTSKLKVGRLIFQALKLIDAGLLAEIPARKLAAVSRRNSPALQHRTSKAGSLRRPITNGSESPPVSSFRPNDRRPCKGRTHHSGRASTMGETALAFNIAHQSFA
jgi:hypothetical protein